LTEGGGDTSTSSIDGGEGEGASSEGGQPPTQRAPSSIKNGSERIKIGGKSHSSYTEGANSSDEEKGKRQYWTGHQKEGADLLRREKKQRVQGRGGR